VRIGRLIGPPQWREVSELAERIYRNSPTNGASKLHEPALFDLSVTSLCNSKLLAD
jgi:hypothetical protein